MAPVTLNKDQSVNKAGIEIDVIPTMRSPCPSPKPKKKKKQTMRAKSEMGFRRENIDKVADEERGSLPDIYGGRKKPGVMDTIMHMSPQRFLSRSIGSTDSLAGSYMSYGQPMAKSVDSTDSLSKGVVMNAVVNWLQKSSPFCSNENIMNQSYSASNDTNASLCDDDDLSELGQFSERSSSRHDNVVPDIFVFEDEVMVVIPESSPHSKLEPCNLQDSPLGNLDPVCAKIPKESLIGNI